MKDERMIRAFASIGPGAEDRERMRKRLQQSLSASDGREREQHRRPSPGMKKRTVVVLAAALVLLLSATTLAATGFFGEIGWRGERIDPPAVTPAPTSMPEIMDDL